MAVDPMGFLSYSGNVLNKTSDLLSKDTVRLNADNPVKERNQKLKNISHVLKEHNEHVEAVRDVGRELRKTLTVSRALNSVTEDVARQTIGTPIPGLQNKIIDVNPQAMQTPKRGSGDATDYETTQAILDNPFSREYPALQQYLQAEAQQPQAQNPMSPAPTASQNPQAPEMMQIQTAEPKQKNDLFSMMNGKGETYQIIPFEAKSFLK